jgi:diaminopimelate epimerase
MALKFTKMNGAGNDFVMIDNRDGSVRLNREQIHWICDRHRGVGADGLLLVEKPDSAGADFRMRYYNADGGEAEMCGNGARCFARFVQSLGWKKSELSFITPAGLIGAKFEGDEVRISLGAPKDLRLAQTIDLESGTVKIHSIDTGVPHVVLFVPDADEAMVGDWGREIRNHPMFQPRGTNVNFVQLKEGNLIRVRTYERGVENETLACGTGVVASAIISHLFHRVPAPVRVQVQGGDTLEVVFSAQGIDVSDVRLKGPADFVFEGNLTLPKNLPLG